MNLAVTMLAITILAISIISSTGYAHPNIVQTSSEIGVSSRYDSLQRIVRNKSWISRDVRRDNTVQLSFHLTPLTPIHQKGVDIDFIMNPDLTLGLSRVVIESIYLGLEERYENTMVHIKQFLGNSFYVKPSVGIQEKTELNRLAKTTVTRQLALQVEVGNEWFLSKNLGINLSYIGTGLKYDDKANRLQEIGILPSIRLFGSF